ncbi:MAG: hypothetical protein ACI9KE_001502, partial [Polyangiales bacterium]
MRRTVLFTVFACACSIDHTGLLSTDGEDAGPETDVVVSDIGTPDPDVVLMPDVFDGGPEVPLPMDCTVHVAAEGSDEASGTAEAPLRTLGAALSTAMPVICVAEGPFDEMLRVTYNVLIRGGYCDGFERFGCTTEIRAPGDRVMQIQGPERIQVELEGLSMETGSTSEAGGSTYGIQVIESDLIIRSSSIRAKNAAAGANAGVGATGPAGENGGDDGRRSGGDECSAGGNGGDTTLGGPESGQDGEGASGAFGLGGPSGSGGNGTDGTEGAPASGEAGPGAGGSGDGTISADAEFQPSAGERGDTGASGGGGGGGGAGNGGINNVGGGGGGGGC